MGQRPGFLAESAGVHRRIIGAWPSAWPCCTLRAPENGIKQRRNQALLPPPHPPGSRDGRPKETQGRERAVHRHRWAGLADQHVPRRRRHRPDRLGGLRRGGLLELAAADRPRHRRRRSLKGRVRHGDDQQHQPERDRRQTRSGVHQRKRDGSRRRLRHRGRRHRQLPDALPNQRRLRAARQAERVRLDLPVRRPGERVRARPRWPVLPLPLPRAATAGHGAQLRRGRRTGCAARNRRMHPGHGDHQACVGRGRFARRPTADFQCARDEVPRSQAAPRSEVSVVRRQPDRQGVDRLQPVLRHPGSTGGAG